MRTFYVHTIDGKLAAHTSGGQIHIDGSAVPLVASIAQIELEQKASEAFRIQWGHPILGERLGFFTVTVASGVSDSELERDTLRLDWLEYHKFDIDWEPSNSMRSARWECANYLTSPPAHCYWGKTARDAIDAAIQGEGS